MIMNKNRLAILLDSLFYSLCVFLLFLCIFRYRKLSLLLSALFASLFAFSFCAAFFLWQTKRRKKKLNSLSEQKRAKRALYSLTLMTEEEQLALLSAALQAEAPLSEPARERKILPLFTLEPLSADGLLKKVRQEKVPSDEPLSVRIFANELSPQAEELAATLSLSVMKGEEIYRLLKKHNLLPPEREESKPSFKKRTAAFFRRATQKSRPFFTSGILLLVMSLFTFYPIYYLVSGSVLLLTGLAIRLFGTLSSARSPLNETQQL